jgi:putative toxin-antitoxin system antitoxin component (TIGR02293 family)
MTATTATAIARRLGGPKVFKSAIRTDIDLATAVARGLPTAAIDALVEGNVVLAHEVGGLLLPVRTLADRRKKRRSLTPDESDRVARVARLHSLAAEALGSEEKAFAWLRRANRSLRGNAPVDLLRTSEGARLAEAALTRLQHGVFA